jgi:hypothetical protein
VILRSQHDDQIGELLAERPQVGQRLAGLPRRALLGRPAG